MKIYKLLILIVLFIVPTCRLKAQIFFPLGSGFDALGSVRALYLDTVTNELYTGGSFIASGNGIPFLKIAKWSGASWDSLGFGVYGGAIEAIEKYNGQIYAAGSIYNFGGALSKGVGIWNGLSWNSFYNFTNNNQNASVYGIRVLDNELYVLGGYNLIDSLPANGVAKFNGNSWVVYPPIDPAGNMVTAIKFNNELYIGGNFDGGIGKQDLVKFDGINWVSVGGGFSGSFTWVNDLAIFQNKLFVAGYFHTANGDPGNGVAIWDGLSWSQAGGGLLPGNVFALHVFQNELYAGGQINNAGGILVSNIAKWNGTTWSNIGGALDNGVSAFASHGNDLFIGGGFWTANGDTMNKITKYNTSVGFSEINDNNLNKIKLFPNPSSGNFTLNFDTKDQKNVKFDMMDIYGRIVFNSSLSENFSIHHILIPEKLANGVYVGRVISGIGVVSGLVELQR